MEWTREDAIKLLPENVCALLREVEDWSGLKIAIQQNSDPPDPDDPFPQVPATIFSHDSATILLRSVDSNPQGTLHELLHLKRYWVEGIPMLTATDGIISNKRITNDLDNQLEHLAIVPQEAAFGFEPY